MSDIAKVSPEALNEAEQADQEEIRSVKDVFQQLAKTAKTLKIYLPNNPIHQKFLSDLNDKFDVHFRSHGPIRLKVRQFELLCAGSVVYENINRMESLAFRMYVDGIREISLLPGLEKEEIIGFLEILGKESEQEADDDTVTLLWERNIRHIRYVVVEDLQLQNNSEEIRSDSEPSLQVEEEQISEMVRQETAVPLDDQAGNGALQEMQTVVIPDLKVFQLTDDEIERIKEEVHQEEESDLIQKLLIILFDILRIEREPILFSEVVGILDHILNTLMMRGDFFHARRILEFYWEMTDPAKELSETIRGSMTDAIKKAGDNTRIRALESVLNSTTFNDVENFFSFLVLLDKNAVGPLADLLGHTAKMRVRRVLCDALVELGKMDLDTMLSRLQSENWYTVRNLIYVLGKIADPRILDGFQTVLHHPEPKVRRELILALEAIADAKVGQILLPLLEDPDGGVRGAALKSISKHKYREAQSELLRIIEGKSFGGRDLQEKKEVFDVVGRISGNEVIPLMRRLIGQKKFLWFRNTRREEMGICAVIALQRVGTPEAIEVLSEGERHSSKAIREASTKALELLLRQP